MNITFNTYPTTTMPSVCAGPFTVSFSARPIACCNEYELSLCAYDSNSYSHYSVQDEDRLYLIPRWRFLDTDFNIVSSLPISTVSGVDGISGTACFWYIDDMPAPDIKINVEVRNIINYPVSSCNISAIMGTTSSSDMISLSVGEWTPQLVKYTSDGISDISAKWTEHPIKWYATLHQELSGPIIFSYSYNLTSDLVSVSSEFCPLTAEVLSFDKSGNYGWTSGSCITNLSSINASISGNAFVLSDSSYVTGTSNEFKIRPFEQPFEIRRQNESWDATKSIKSYAMAPHLNSKYNLWDNFIGHSVGQLSAGQQLGRKSYERIANFPANHIDIDESNVKQLYSLSQYLDVPIDDYDLNYPPELQRLIDIGSISHSKLWGEIVKCNLNITDDQICPRCGYKHTNLGDMIVDPFSYTVTAGIPFIQHDRFNLSPDGWTIEYPPYMMYNDIFNWYQSTIPVGSFGSFRTIKSSTDNKYQVVAGVSSDGDWWNPTYISRILSSIDYGQTWNEINFNIPNNIFIYEIAMDATGLQQSFCGPNIGIYNSIDGGLNWTQSDAPSAGIIYGDIVMSGDGTYRIATTFLHGVYISYDSGITWTKDVSLPDMFWGKLAMSKDGNYTYMVKQGEGIYRKVGANPWELKSNIIDVGDICTNDDGKYITILKNSIIGTYTGPTVPPFDNNIYESTVWCDENYIEGPFSFGLKVISEQHGITPYKSIDMSGNGKYQLLGGKDIMTSNNYGVNWYAFSNIPSVSLVNQIIGSTVNNDGVHQSAILGSNIWYGTKQLIELPFNIYSDSTHCSMGTTTAVPVSTYPMTVLTAYDIDLCSSYDYYEYVDGYPRIETCLPLASAYVQAAGVINRNDEYNTLDVYSVSSVEDWFGDDGKLQEAIEYELLRGLQLNSQTCNISS